jgi:V/A-type H+-transporting ATPase subunit E
MGYQELIASLRKEGSEKVKALHQETRAESEKIHEEEAEMIAKLMEEFREKEEALEKSQADRFFSAAQRTVRTIRLKAEANLADRLFGLALSCLHELRQDKYEKTFELLVNELPSTWWNEAVVHPDDKAMAETHFPNAEVVTDPAVIGGIEVYRENRRQHVINTFGKRLERAWEELLPLIVRDIYRESS